MKFCHEFRLPYLRNTKWNFWSLLSSLFPWDNTNAMDWSIKINYPGARQHTEDARHCKNADSLYYHQFYWNRHANYCTLILLKLGKFCHFARILISLSSNFHASFTVTIEMFVWLKKIYRYLITQKYLFPFYI